MAAGLENHDNSAHPGHHPLRLILVEHRPLRRDGTLSIPALQLHDVLSQGPGLVLMKKCGDLSAVVL